jgi:hypothetical protein
MGSSWRKVLFPIQIGWIALRINVSFSGYDYERIKHHFQNLYSQVLESSKVANSISIWLPGNHLEFNAWSDLKVQFIFVANEIDCKGQHKEVQHINLFETIWFGLIVKWYVFRVTRWHDNHRKKSGQYPDAPSKLLAISLWRFVQSFVKVKTCVGEIFFYFILLCCFSLPSIFQNMV